jgi:transmembrane sensor
VSALGEHLSPELSPARLARNRAAIEGKLARRTGPWRWAVGASSVAALASIAFFLWPSRAPELAVNEAVWVISPGARVTASAQPSTVQLEDGSRIELAPHASLIGVARSEAELSLELETGEASFDVAPDPHRTFRVRSGDVLVQVLGTAFTVERSDGRVTVAVTRGRVEVLRGDERSVLGAGDRWSADEHVSMAPTVEAPRAEEASVEEVVEEITRAGGRSRSVEAPIEDPARALFEAAQIARREGRPDSAAALFAELIEQYPGDARAGLAAFELGRIRLDVMHDVPGSIEALERSLALSRHGGYRQDALARLVLLYARTSETARCREAQSRYLADYPDGVHLLEVRSACE